MNHQFEVSEGAMGSLRVPSATIDRWEMCADVSRFPREIKQPCRLAVPSVDTKAFATWRIFSWNAVSRCPKKRFDLGGRMF
jgi:hypothetical protein